MTLTVYSAVSPGLTVCALGLIETETLIARPSSSALTGFATVGISENANNATSKILGHLLSPFVCLWRGSMNPGRGTPMKSLCAIDSY